MSATLKIGDQIGLASTALGDIQEVRGPFTNNESETPYWSVCYSLDRRTLWLNVQPAGDGFADLSGNRLHHRFRFSEESNGQYSLV